MKVGAMREGTRMRQVLDVLEPSRWYETAEIAVLIACTATRTGDALGVLFATGYIVRRRHEENGQRWRWMLAP